MKLTILAVVGLAVLAGCADYRERDRASRAGVAVPGQRPAASIDSSNAGQTPAVTSGSASNAASGSQVTPSR